MVALPNILLSGVAMAAYPNMPLYKLPQDQGAACLDGTAPAYWFLNASSSTSNTKYYINFEGGGWCTSLKDCAGRAGSRKGSSNNLPDPFNLESLIAEWGNWYFSDKTELNPIMSDWNKLQVLYCDGASWTGSNSTTTEVDGKKLYFRGKNNIDALMTALLTQHGMDQATEVVISGGSAGALAVYLHADALRAQLPPSAKVVALPDDGFFMDNAASRASGWTAAKQWVYTQHNSSAGVPAACLAQYSREEQWKCFFAQYVSPTIKTPLFALQPMYDAYQTGVELQSTVPAKVNAYGVNLTATLKAAVLAASPKNGGYLDGCWHHGGGWPAMQALSATDKTWASPMDAFTVWYNADPVGSGANRYWQTPSSGLLPDGRAASAFPCKNCCPCKPYNETSGNFNQACK